MVGKLRSVIATSSPFTAETQRTQRTLPIPPTSHEQGGSTQGHEGTRVALWPASRGMYTPSPSPATIFRDRARHRVTILLDVEDLPRLLQRGSDLGDLVLNSFERDGVIRRCTRPDARPEDQVETFAAYGATIVATNRSVRDSSPLASRCIRLSMPEAGGRLVPDAMRPDEARVLRARAVAWAARPG